MGIGTLRRYHGAPKVDQPQAAVPDAPAKSAKADEWKTYAAARGWDATATKAAIIEQYEADLAAHSNEGDERVVSTPTGTTTETVQTVNPSEPAPVGEAEQRDADKPGEGVTTAADLGAKSEQPAAPADAPEPDKTSPDSERAGAENTQPASEAK